MVGRIRRALRALPFMPQAALDVLRKPGRTAGAFPAASPARRARDRLRAVSIIVRTASLLLAPFGCRRKAFAYCRALARGGVPVRLLFGIRKARHGDARKGSYIGHVWASAVRDRRAPGLPGGHIAVAEVPGAETTAGWRRG
ncbi:MAG: lasso peptide biosynthesis protein [Planctomycetota bacterium]